MLRSRRPHGAVRVLSRDTLKKAWQKYRDAEGPLRAWYAEAKAAAWRNPDELRARYRTVSIIGKDRAVFNIKGNTYRLIVRIKFRPRGGAVFVRFFGTHAEYDKIDAAKV